MEKNHLEFLSNFKSCLFELGKNVPLTNKSKFSSMLILEIYKEELSTSLKNGAKASMFK